MSEPLRDIRAAVFDAYGTLFDVHAAAARHREALGSAADRVSEVWRTKQLEYTWLRSAMGRWVDFWQVTTDALDVALEVAGISDDALRQQLLSAYRTLDAYPEVAQTLRSLRSAGLATAILSNGSAGMLADAVSSARLGGLFDHVISVDSIRVYKPEPAVYGLAVERLGLPAHSVAFHTSNAWDAAGARAFGFQVVWVNRREGTTWVERLPERPTAEVRTLTDTVPLLVR